MHREKRLTREHDHVALRTARRPSLSATTTTSPASTLTDLPDDAAALLTAFLDAHSLAAAARCCRGVPRSLVHAFQQTRQLTLPPDATRNALLVKMIQTHEAAARVADVSPQLHTHLPLALPAQFAIADTRESATLLLPIRDHVRGLAVSSNEYTAWTQPPFQWGTLQQFTALARLEIDHTWNEPVDLAALSLSLPHLHELVIKRARQLMNQLTHLPMLRGLHLEDTNLDSFTIAVGLPTLQSLTLMTTPYAYQYLRDVASLAIVAPLTRLVVRGLWETCPRAALARHIETLREYAEHDTTRTDSLFPRWQLHPQWSQLTQLRSLRMGRFGQVDTQPLTALVGLEHLQITMLLAVATHCRPLRHLTRLRELHLGNGFPCDLVGYLPRLVKLVWEDYSWPYNDARLVLYRRELPHLHDGNDEASVRRHAMDNDAAVGVSTGLRVLVVRGNMRVDLTDPSVRVMLEHVEHLEVHDCNHTTDELLAWAMCRRHLKRLLLKNIQLPRVYTASTRRVSLASATSLEEVYYRPRYPGESEVEPPAPFPLWLADRLPKLRVLASPYHESLVELAPLCPRLTHVHVPFSTACAFPYAPRDSLRRLCVVSLAVEYDCVWLRAECRAEGALPLLRRIFHPTTDCLSSPVCRRQQIAVSSTEWGLHDAFKSERVLVPAWAQKWEWMSRCREDEHYHRIVNDNDSGV